MWFDGLFDFEVVCPFQEFNEPLLPFTFFHAMVTSEVYGVTHTLHTCASMCCIYENTFYEIKNACV